MVGFDDLPFACLLTPGLTTVRQPAREMGAQATKLLLSMVDGETPTSPPPVTVTPMIRESTGPVPLA